MKMRTIPSLVIAAVLFGCNSAQSLDWEAKDAHRHCAAAIDGCPGSPPPPCAAMHMCINEASLSEAQRGKLIEMIRVTEGCEEP